MNTITDFLLPPLARHGNPLTRYPGFLASAFLKSCVVLSCLFSSCVLGWELDRDPGPAVDLIPPRIQDIRILEERRLQAEFDKPLDRVQAGFLEGDLEFSEPVLEEAGLELTWREDGVPGRLYPFELIAWDNAGNSSRLIYSLEGRNPRLPRVVLNEVSPRGSGRHPDMVELLVLEAGNIQGMSLADGRPEDQALAYSFPDHEVLAGDLLLVHLQPQGLDEEITETHSQEESGGLNASPLAWDFWLPVPQGLGSNNGILVLRSSPRGAIMDCLVWSNRTSLSDSNYRGWGSRLMENRVDWLQEQGSWDFGEGPAAPEGAVNPDGSTATRTLNRRAGTTGSRQEDWYIVPTSGATWGAPNNPEEYSP